MRPYCAVACIFLVGCDLRPPVAVAPQADQDTARDKWISCLKADAKTMDDHVSDAGTVARAVAGACHQQFTLIMDMSGLSENMARVQQDSIRNPAMAAVYMDQQQKMDQMEQSFATRAVLETRANRR